MSKHDEDLVYAKLQDFYKFTKICATEEKRFEYIYRQYFSEHVAL
jgi:hypothetical protein